MLLIPHVNFSIYSSCYKAISFSINTIPLVTERAWARMKEQEAWFDALQLDDDITGKNPGFTFRSKYCHVSISNETGWFC